MWQRSSQRRVAGPTTHVVVDGSSTATSLSSSASPSPPSSNSFRKRHRTAWNSKAFFLVTAVAFMLWLVLNHQHNYNKSTTTKLYVWDDDDDDVDDGTPSQVHSSSSSQNHHDQHLRGSIPLLKASCLSDRQKVVTKTIIVIGAGVAGLTAAKRLVRHQQHLQQQEPCLQLTVQILEASSHMGGRVQKDSTFVADYPIDLGASWIYDPSRLAIMAQDREVLPKMKSKLIKTNTLEDTTSYEFYQDGSRREISMGTSNDYLWVNYTWYDFLEQQLASALHPSQFVYDCVVDRVLYHPRRHNVLVGCDDDRTFVADHVLVTVPLSILKDRDIEFRPKLPPYVLQHTGKMWQGFKLFLEFSTKFYPEYFIYEIEDGELDWWDYSLVQPNSTTRNVLAGYYMGDPMTPMLDMTEHERVRYVLRHLDETFGNRQASRYYQRHLMVDWSRNPHIRGTYSNVGLDPEAAMGPGGPQPVWRETRLVVAGEAFPIPPNHNGWVDGAALSGLHAAELILKEIDPQRFVSPRDFSIPKQLWKLDPE